MLKKVFFLFLLLIISLGCSQRIMMLKNLASSQKQMEKYVARQKRGFLRLKQDIQSNRLKKDIPKSIIIRRYGEPIFCDPVEDGTPAAPIRPGATVEDGTPAAPIRPGAIVQSCLYRAPTEYFSADKAYLYFNKEDLLHSWKFDPAE